jgi:hypothetical protein
MCAEFGESRQRGHGGNRIAGTKGENSARHDVVSSKEMNANAWFLREKESYADHVPNPASSKSGLYQIDEIFSSDYYSMYVNDQRDNKIPDSEIASRKLWNHVWEQDHPDLAMRKHKNVDSKDMVHDYF